MKGRRSRRSSVFKRVRYFLTRQVRIDAGLLDYMQEHPETVPDPDPPKTQEEFLKILNEMERRGIRPAIKRQLKWKRLLEKLLKRNSH